MVNTPGDDSKVVSIMFGHCAFAPTALDKHTCPGLSQRFYHGLVKKGRKRVDGIIYLDEYHRCTCLCHVPEDERPKPRRRRTAKKAVAKKTAKKAASKKVKK